MPIVPLARNTCKQLNLPACICLVRPLGMTKDVQQESLDYLPVGYEYCVCQYEETGDEDSTWMHKTRFRVKLATEECAKKWFAELQNRSKVTWRVDKTYGKKRLHDNLYKVDYRCQHNTKPRTTTANLKKRSKNTNCRATFSVTLKNVTDGLLQHRGFLLVCVVSNCHNHSVQSADAARHFDVSLETRETLEKLFASGHSPSTALDFLKQTLQDEHGHGYVYVAANRSVCPDLQYCYRLYNKLFKKVDGDSSNDDDLATLNRNVLLYNEEHGQQCIKIADLEGQMIVAICTPFMKRVHTLWPSSGDMVFIDSAGGMDRMDHRVFLLLTHSSAGGLPLGIIVTSSDSQETITFGLKLLQEILPVVAFFGRGELGPKVIITDDSETERGAIREVYPGCDLLLCIFNVLQAMWRWLWDSKHQVSKEHRTHLLSLFSRLLHSEDPEQLQSRYNELASDPATGDHDGYLDHVNNLMIRQSEWAVWYRHNLMIRRNQTNSYAEAGIRMLKERIFNRTKVYNLCQLVDFFCKRLEFFFERELMDVANNKLPIHSLHSRLYPTGGNVQGKQIVQVTDVQFTVHSKKSAYEVEMDLGMCSCPVGYTGAPCKHQGAVSLKFPTRSSINMLPTHSAEQRQLYFKLATGRSDVNIEWFAPLRGNMHTGIFDKAGVTKQPVFTTSAKFCSGEPKEDLMQKQTDAQLCSDIQTFTDFLLKKLKDEPSAFREPLRKFADRAVQWENESQLIEALSTFGRSNSFPTVRKMAKSATLQTTATISVKPTALNRKVVVGGTKNVRSGRPRKVEGQTGSYVIRKKKKTAATHSIETSIAFAK